MHIQKLSGHSYIKHSHLCNSTAILLFYCVSGSINAFVFHILIGKVEHYLVNMVVGLTFVRVLAIRGDWKCETGIIGTIKNAGVENAGLEISAPNCRGGKCGTKQLWKAKTFYTLWYKIRKSLLTQFEILWWVRWVGVTRPAPERADYRLLWSIKSFPKSFGKSHVAIPYDREWTRPLRVLLSVQCSLQVSPTRHYSFSSLFDANCGTDRAPGAYNCAHGYKKESCVIAKMIGPA